MSASQISPGPRMDAADPTSALPPARVNPPRVRAWTGGGTTLVYALWTEPSPLTVSLPDVASSSGTLQLVVTNPLETPVVVSAIGVTLQMGTHAADLALDSDDIGRSVSDEVNWVVTPPGGVVDSGPATWTVGPKTGEAATLPGRASITVQLIGIRVNRAVGTARVSIVERLEDGTSGEQAFDVTKFPHGFFFEGLAATVRSGSEQVAVAQVLNGTRVTLTWDCSVTAPGAFSVLYTRSDGQRKGVVTTPGEYVVPEPLTIDTVFVVQVDVTGPGGQSLHFTLATAVSVQEPDIRARSLTAIGPEGIIALRTIPGQSIRFDLASKDASLSVGAPGEVRVDAVGVSGGRFIVASDGKVGINRSNPQHHLDVGGDVSAGGEVSANSLASSGSLSVAAPGEVRVDAGGVPGGRFIVAGDGKVGIGNPNPRCTLDVEGTVSLLDGPGIQVLEAGTYVAPTDGFAVGKVDGSLESSAYLNIFGRYGPIRLDAVGGCFLQSRGGGAVGASFTLPVPANTRFTLGLVIPDGIPHPSHEFYWVPMGNGKANPS